MPLRPRNSSVVFPHLLGAARMCHGQGLSLCGLFVVVWEILLSSPVVSYCAVMIACMIV